MKSKNEKQAMKIKDDKKRREWKVSNEEQGRKLSDKKDKETNDVRGNFVITSTTGRCEKQRDGDDKQGNTHEKTK